MQASENNLLGSHFLFCFPGTLHMKSITNHVGPFLAPSSKAQAKPSTSSNG
jgi:hypothetical protein